MRLWSGDLLASFFMNAPKTEKIIKKRGEIRDHALYRHAQELENALREIVRRSELLIHQNTGRWDMRVEHDSRSFGVTDGNIRIARDVLG